MLLYKFYFSTPKVSEKNNINMKFLVCKNIATTPPPFLWPHPVSGITIEQIWVYNTEGYFHTRQICFNISMCLFVFDYDSNKLKSTLSEDRTTKVWAFRPLPMCPPPPPWPLKIMILTNLKIQYQKIVFSIKYNYKIQAPSDFNLSRRLAIWKIK